MDYIIAKIYELLIRLKLKGKYARFEYSVLVARGFTEYFVKPNTMNRVTVYFYRWWYGDYGDNEKHLTFKNIKDAYQYFK